MLTLAQANALTLERMEHLQDSSYAGHAVRHEVTQGNALRRRITTGTSGATFVAADWTPDSSSVGKARAQHTANAGTALACGSIQLRMNTTTNRSLQISTNTGADLAWRALSFWHGGSSQTLRTGAVANGGWQLIEPSYNFTAQGDWQHSMIFDETNNRTYTVMYSVANNSNNSPMMIAEI